MATSQDPLRAEQPTRLPKAETESGTHEPTEAGDATLHAEGHREGHAGALSDVAPVTDGTLSAPSFPGPSPAAPSTLPPGARIDDFEVLRLLGKGAFGVVYLARQLSLDRRVALKVAANQGSEGRTMARLEHDHIVQVFSETVDSTGMQRLLCMQLVPGAPLEDVIRALHRGSTAPCSWRGADYLAVVEARAQVDDVLDSAALRDRELIAGLDDVGATAWVGARLAEAIDYAHRQGVLHRDIKPANVLVNQYGRPLLADFNIAHRATGSEVEPDDTFGGTLAFMAPEHLDAFNPSSGGSPQDVDERSDLYSLAIVVYELLEGRPPFRDPPRGSSRARFLRDLAAHRRTAPPPIPVGPPDARKTLLRTVCMALSPEKACRPESGAALAAALDGCRRLRGAEQALPPPNGVTLRAWRRPFRWIVAFALAPQLVGSLVNIAYNSIEIVGRLNDSQKTTFMQLVAAYNVVVYPAALLGGALVLLPLWRVWRKLEGPGLVDAEEARRARRWAVCLPLWVLFLAACGWLPGGVLFPQLLHLLDPPIERGVTLHFITSFTLSGLIAAAYSFAGIQYLVLRVLYPRLWVDASGFRDLAREELASTPRRIRLLYWLAGSIPLLAAMSGLILLDFAGEGPAESLRYRLLIGALVWLGWFGYQVALSASGGMAKAYTALTGREA